MQASISTRVIEVFQKAQHLEDGKVKPESTFAELSIDSLDGLQIVFALEEAFAVSIPDDAAKQFRTVQQTIDGVTALLEAKGLTAKNAAMPSESVG